MLNKHFVLYYNETYQPYHKNLKDILIYLCKRCQARGYILINNKPEFVKS